MVNYKIVKLNYKYCDFLREFDYRVAYNSGSKELRPYIGVLFKIADIEYFAPLSSPKPKHKSIHRSIDMIKLDDGNLGVINLNNMLPVLSNNYEILDLNSPKNISEIKRYNLLKKQLRWLNSNRISINKKANNLYKMYVNGKLSDNIKSRCCNFILLESKCKEYNNLLISV